MILDAEIITEQPITGYGGGGGKNGGGGEAHTPTEVPDSLHSRSFARVLDLICEGEIGGLVSGMQSIYFDNTPVQNIDGSFNFFNCSFDGRLGTQGQTYLPGFASVESSVAVGVKVTTVAPHTEHIVNVNANAVRISVGIPTLLQQDTSNGDTNGTSVNIQIDLQTNGGGFVTKIDDTISGKTTTRYERDYTLELTGTGPWDVRVRRITADSTSVALANETWWDTYTVIVDSKLSYPNSALMGTVIDSAQFRSIPTRSYDVKLLLVRVPSNYNPTSRVYTGVWDGTFQIAWTDNPAWCFYDLLSNPRYGLGKYIPVDLIDKWSLYSIGQYCDQLVDDGFGGVEPRFTCNLYLQSQEEAFNVVSHFASIFRSIVYWSSVGLTAVQDAPTSPIALFNATNVIDGIFEYSGSSSDARHTVALVTWNDPDNNYKQAIEYVEDTEGISNYGVKITSFVAFGCTSRGQARRAGLWALYSEKSETETVSFKTGLQYLSIYPGAVINVQDSARAGLRFGGRVISATTLSLTMDAPVTVETGLAYTCWVQLPDGSIVEKPVANAPGITSVLNFNTALSVAPQADSVWVLTASNLKPQTFRVISIQESGPLEYSVTALAHNPSKFAAIEDGLQLEPPPISVLPSPGISAPLNIQFHVNGYQDGESVRRGLLVSWDKPSLGTAVKYLLKWRRNTDAYTTVEGILARSYEITPAFDGLYDVVVYAFNAIGNQSAGATASFLVDLTENTGSLLNPVTNFTVVGGGTSFTGRDLNVIWTNPSSNNNVLATLKDFKVEVYDSDSNLLRVEYVPAVAPGATQTYAYTFTKNSADTGGPHRTVRLVVRTRDTNNKLSTGNSVTFTNPAPAIPNNISVIGFFEGFRLFFDYPAETDFEGVVVWASQTNGFTPSAAEVVFDGKSNAINVTTLAGGATYYFRVAAYDTFGKDYTGAGLNLSGQQSVVTVAAIPADILTDSLGTSNLTANGDFEVDANSDGLADGWNIYNTTGGETTTASLPSGGGIFGPKVQRISWATTNSSQKGIYRDLANGIGWIAGKTYTISCYVRASGNAVGKKMQLLWTVAPASVTEVHNPVLSSTFQRYAWTIVMGGSVEPNGAVYFSIDSTTASGSNYLEFDGFQIQMGDNLTEFNPIAPGTIYGINIAATSITANNLAGNTITGDKIAANTIVASKLAVDFLSAINANVGTLDSGIIYNAAHTKYLNLSSGDTGSSWFIYSPNFYVRGDGFTYIGANAVIEGNLSAASGTFAGTLTAANIISTGHIVSNAVTASASANANTIVFTSTGNPLLIMAQGHSGGLSDYIMDLIIDSSTVRTVNCSAGGDAFVLHRVILSAGAHTIQVSNVTSNILIVILETKR